MRTLWILKIYLEFNKLASLIKWIICTGKVFSLFFMVLRRLQNVRMCANSFFLTSFSLRLSPRCLSSLSVFLIPGDRNYVMSWKCILFPLESLFVQSCVQFEFDFIISSSIYIQTHAKVIEPAIDRYSLVFCLSGGDNLSKLILDKEIVK